MARTSDLFAGAVEGILSLVAPPRCAACDSSVPMLSVFCVPCATTVEPSANAGKLEGAAVAAFVYGGAIARAIVRFKYEHRPDLARPLGDLLWRALQRRNGLSDAVVVPVPLHPSRLADRGFNQSALLATRIARHLRRPVLPLALRRTRETRSQAALARDERIANCAGAFRARRPASLHGRSILLIDDVQTTGATLAACSRALFDAGALRVTEAVIARAE